MSKLVGAIAGIAMITGAAAPQIAAADDWPSFGHSVQNTASSADENTISSHNVAYLAPKWVLTTGGYVSARAAVVNKVAYFPDAAGNVFAANTQTGAVLWKVNLTAFGFPSGTYSRSSPAVVGQIVYLGTQATPTGAYLLALNASNGSLKWSTKLDANPAAILTAAPVVSGGVVYQGVASLEESFAANPAYPCCSFRGSVAAVDANTGAVKWQTYVIPPGYTGGGVWGSHAVVDPARNTLYIGTGDNYSTPTDPAFVACATPGQDSTACLSPDDHFDSVLALDMTTGAVKWAQRLWSQDDWNVACFYNAPGGANCPKPEGPDYDFGSAPQEFTVGTGANAKTLIGAGQKSGVYAAFNADTGAMVWATQVGPGSALGGIEWGSATDGARIYVAVANFFHLPYADGRTGSGTAGSWNALDPATGKVLWRTADPSGAIDLGPMAVANGVVYAPSSAGGASQPNMLALDASSGKVLWNYASGGSVIAGATVANGTVFWGSGYNLGGLPIFTPGNNKFYAFSLGGN